MSINRVGGSSGEPPPADQGSAHPDRSARRFAGADGSDVSELARLMSDLQQLQQSDGERFKRVASRVVDLLEVAEREEARSPILGQLALTFRRSAETGSMPALEPAMVAAGVASSDHRVQSYAMRQPQATSDAQSWRLVLVDAIGTAMRAP